VRNFFLSAVSAFELFGELLPSDLASAADAGKEQLRRNQGVLLYKARRDPGQSRNRGSFYAVARQPVDCVALEIARGRFFSDKGRGL
jgi:hypothetical protein